MSPLLADTSWRPARSLLILRDQVNAAWPDRNKASDGMIGDPRHQAEPTSDHNPALIGGEWIVCAFDITHDPAHGVDCGRIAAAMVLSHDPRIKYLIWNRRILDSRPQFHPWTWQPYTGDPHTSHLHVSVLANVCDDTRTWHIGDEELSIVDIASRAYFDAMHDDINRRIGVLDRNSAARLVGIVDPAAIAAAVVAALPIGTGPLTEEQITAATEAGMRAVLADAATP